MQINQYSNEAFTINDEDFYDVDYWTGSNYQSRKISGLTLKTILGGLAATIYNSDGTITGPRVVDLAGNFLTFESGSDAVIQITAPNSAAINLVRASGAKAWAIVKDVDANSDFRIDRHDVTGTYLDTPIKIHTSDGSIEFNGAYRFPTSDGLANEVLATDGLGGLYWVSMPTSINIYNADGTLTGDRTLTGNNFVLLLQTLGQFLVHSHKNNVDNVVFEVRTQPGFNSFLIKDHNTGDELFGIKNGIIEFNNAYRFPTTDGLPDYVLMTDGAGNVQWVGLSDLSIYTSNGALNSNRFVDLVDFFLQFDGFDGVSGKNVSARWDYNMTEFLNADPSGAGKNSAVYVDADIAQLVHNEGVVNRRVRVDLNGFQINGAYYLPNVDGTAGYVLTTNGAGITSWQPVGAATEKKIDSFYAYDMSQAATYLWNGVANVGATTLTTLNSRSRLQIFSGTGGANGCFVNTILPNYYVAGNSITVTCVFTTNGTGGNVRFYVGLNKPTAGNLFQGAAGDEWQNYTFAAQTGFPVVQHTFTFLGTNLSAGEPISVMVYRDPGDAADTFTGDAYINTINIEQV